MQLGSTHLVLMSNATRLYSSGVDVSNATRLYNYAHHGVDEQCN